MKTKPITIEPGSGTKLAGKKVVVREYVGDKLLVWEIIYVGTSSFMAKNTMCQNEDICKIYPQNEWLEVLPDDPPVHEEFFKKYGEAIFEAQHFEEFGKHIMSDHKIEDLYQAFESRILAKLKSEGVVK